MCLVNSSGLYKGRWVCAPSPNLFLLLCFSWWKVTEKKKQVFHLLKANTLLKSGRMSSFNLGQSAPLSFVCWCGQQPGDGFVPDIWGGVIFAVSQGVKLCCRLCSRGFRNSGKNDSCSGEAVLCTSSQFLLGTHPAACEESVLWTFLYFWQPRRAGNGNKEAVGLIRWWASQQSCSPRGRWAALWFLIPDGWTKRSRTPHLLLRRSRALPPQQLCFPTTFLMRTKCGPA